VAAFLGLALVVGLVYHEFSREMPSAAESVPASPEETSHGREIRALQASVDRNPQDYELLLSLANRLQDYAIQDRSLLPRAVEAYTRYLDANPASQNPRVDLGICYFELSKLEPARANEYVLMAIREMETVYNANPQHQPAAFNLGIVHLSAGHLDQATEWFRRAVTINENSELGQRAQRLLEQHAFEQSVN
jgi:tetratricopeptide (TPR) repeat protein